MDDDLQLLHDIRQSPTFFSDLNETALSTHHREKLHFIVQRQRSSPSHSILISTAASKTEQPLQRAWVDPAVLDHDMLA